MGFSDQAVTRMSAFSNDCRAVTSLEFGIIAVVIVVAGMAGFSAIGTSTASKMTSVKTAVGAP